MNRCVWIPLLASAGCAGLLGFEDLHARDAGALDSLDAAPPDTAGCDAGLSVTEVIEDTMLLDDGNPNPAIRHGKDDTINVGQNGTSRVILRFDLPMAMADALALETGAIEATLGVTIRASGGACGGSCPNIATTFQVFAATDGWNEG